MRFWWRAALKCGLPHPDFLFAVLSYRQQRELEVYSRIESIEGVSSAAAEEEKPAADRPPSFDEVVNMLM